MSNSPRDQKYNDAFAAGFAEGLRACKEQIPHKQVDRTFVQTNRRSPSEDNNRQTARDTFTNTIKKTRLSGELPNRQPIEKRNFVTNTKREIVRPSPVETTRRIVENRYSKPEEIELKEKFNNPVRRSIENPFTQHENRTYRIDEHEIQQKYPIQTRGSNDNPVPSSRENRSYRPGEHEMEGRNTLPDAEVQLNSRGHY